LRSKALRMLLQVRKLSSARSLRQPRTVDTTTAPSWFILVSPLLSVEIKEAVESEPLSTVGFELPCS
jgi:hypothetical protein